MRKDTIEGTVQKLAEELGITEEDNPDLMRDLREAVKKDRH